MKSKKSFILNKPRAKTEIYFKYDESDDWFVDIIHRDVKSKEITRITYITGRMFQQWLDDFIKDGWTKKDDIK